MKGRHKKNAEEDKTKTSEAIEKCSSVRVYTTVNQSRPFFVLSEIFPNSRRRRRRWRRWNVPVAEKLERGVKKRNVW